METTRPGQPNATGLAERVALLERRLRRERLLLGAAAVATVCIAAAGRQDTDSVRARSFQVVDDSGAVVGEFKSDAMGAELSVRSARGDAAVRVHVDEYGGAVRTFHDDGRKGVEVRQAPVATGLSAGLVNVFDHEGAPTVTLGSGVRGRGPVSMGAHYDGGAVVVVRKGVLVHLADPHAGATGTGGRGEDAAGGSTRGETTDPPTAIRTAAVQADDNAQIGTFVRRIFQDRKGDLWFGTNGLGVCRYDGERVAYFSTQEGLGGTQVTGIQEDGKGNMWFSNSGGVSRYDGSSITNYTEKDGLSSNSVWSLLVDREGTIWAGTRKGICRFDGTRFVPFALPASPVRNPQSRFNPKLASSMFQDTKGNIWFGLDGTGVCKYDPPGSGHALRTDGTSFTYFTMQDGLCDNSIVCVLEDRNGNMWFSSRFGGVSRYDGASFTNFTAPDDIGNNEVWTLHEDRSGAIWFVSEGFGVYRYDGKTLTNFAAKEGLPVLAAQSIFEDREGRFWVGGYGGLFRREGGTFVDVRRGGPWGDP